MAECYLAPALPCAVCAYLHACWGCSWTLCRHQLCSAALSAPLQAYNRVVAPDELVTGGPYALVQHPIYSSYMLLFAGNALRWEKTTNYGGELRLGAIWPAWAQAAAAWRFGWWFCHPVDRPPCLPCCTAALALQPWQSSGSSLAAGWLLVVLQCAHKARGGGTGGHIWRPVPPIPAQHGPLPAAPALSGGLCRCDSWPFQLATMQQLFTV